MNQTDKAGRYPLYKAILNGSHPPRGPFINVDPESIYPSKTLFTSFFPQAQIPSSATAAETPFCTTLQLTG